MSTPGTTALGLSAAAAWGAGDFTGGVASRRAHVFAVLVAAHASGIVLLSALALLVSEPAPARAALGWAALAGIAGAVGLTALWRAFAVGKMGIAAPVAAVLTAVLPVLVGIASAGLPLPRQLAGFACAAARISLVARSGGEPPPRPGPRRRPPPPPSRWSRADRGGLLLVLRALLHLGADQIAQRAEALAGRLVRALVALVVGAVRPALGGGAAEAEAAAVVDLDDLRLELGADGRGLLVVAAARRAQLGVWHQALARGPDDEHAEGLDPLHLRIHHVADLGARAARRALAALDLLTPLAAALRRGHRIGGLRLLLGDPAQGHPLGAVVDRLDLHPDRLALLDHLARA